MFELLKKPMLSAFKVLLRAIAAHRPWNAEPCFWNQNYFVFGLSCSGCGSPQIHESTSSSQATSRRVEGLRRRLATCPFQNWHEEHFQLFLGGCLAPIEPMKSHLGCILAIDPTATYLPDESPRSSFFRYSPALQLSLRLPLQRMSSAQVLSRFVGYCRP